MTTMTNQQTGSATNMQLKGKSNFLSNTKHGDTSGGPILAVVVSVVRKVYEMAQIQHNRSRYQAGCRCDVCRKAQSDSRKRLRQRKNAGRQLRLAAPPAAGPGTGSATLVSDAVQLELDTLGVAESRPGLAAAALAMAAISIKSFTSRSSPRRLGG
jgi:hypothetical protein